MLRIQAVAQAHDPASALLAEHKRYREALIETAKALENILTHYGTGLEVLNWHQNGDTEALDNFFDENGLPEALNAARAALNKEESK